MDVEFFDDNEGGRIEEWISYYCNWQIVYCLFGSYNLMIMKLTNNLIMIWQ